MHKYIFSSVIMLTILFCMLFLEGKNIEKVTGIYSEKKKKIKFYVYCVV